jgi:hypothetical protein
LKTQKFTTFFIPNSHKRICEFGLSGQRHVGNGLDVDEMQALQAGDVLNVRRKIARRSISPQINISYMPLTDQENKMEICLSTISKGVK